MRTKAKLKIARLLNWIIVGSRALVGLPLIVQISREGRHWELDLSEGVDLAIYLGLYQKLPRRVIYTDIKPGSILIDIGANIGAHAIPMASYVGDGGRVVAVEPTRYAFGKLVRNIALNPELASRIFAIHAALNEGGASARNEQAFYSRWPLSGQATDRHAEHMGQFELSEGARFLTLDALISEMRDAELIAGNISFVKLDVDGNELSVLQGGAQTLANEKPVILIEIAPHVQDEVPLRFERLLSFLGSFGYRLEFAGTGKPMPSSAPELRTLIGFGASIDAIARSN